MYRSRLTLALLLGCVIGSACTPDSPVSPEAVAIAVVDEAPLVRAPRLTAADLIQTASNVPPIEPAQASEHRGPALSELDGEDEGELQTTIIRNEDTRIAFEPGFVGAYGTHEHTGNVGSITTTLQVAYNDQHLGSQVGSRQDYTPFLGDLGQFKHIWVFPKVYTDHECGLTASGSSQHAAWWQWYQATSVQTWGRVGKFSQSGNVSQGGCSSGEVGGFETENAKPGGVVCTYWITYDLETGEIVDAELLYCESVGGEEM